MENEILKKTQALADALIVELRLKEEEKNLKVALLKAHSETLRAKDEIREIEHKINEPERPNT